MKDKSLDDILEATFRDVDPGPTPKDEKGRYITGPAHPPFENKELARAAINKRWSDVEEASQRGMVAGVEKSGLRVANGSEAWEKIVEARTIQAIEQKGRSGTNDAALVGRASGFIRDRREVDVRSMSMSLSAEVDEVDFVLSVMTRKYPDDADKALREALLYRKDPQAWLKEN